VEGGEAGDLGDASRPGRRDGRPPLLERRVGSEDTQRVHRDGDRAAGAVGESRGEPGPDGGAALGALALLVYNQGVLDISRSGGGGVARIERLRERRDQRGERFLVVAVADGPRCGRRGLLLARGLLGPQARADPEQYHAARQTKGSHSCDSRTRFEAGSTRFQRLNVKGSGRASRARDRRRTHWKLVT